MGYKGRYVHAETIATDISSPGPLLELETRGRDQLEIYVRSDVNADFELQADFGDGTFVPVETFPGKNSVAQPRDIAADRVRVSIVTSESAGDTADVKLAAV